MGDDRASGDLPEPAATTETTDDARRGPRRLWFAVLAAAWTIAFAALLLDPSPTVPDNISPDLVNGLGHFGGTALLTVLIALAIDEFTNRSRTVAAVVAAVVLTAVLAIGAESIQSLLASRTSGGSDIALDVAGISFGVLVIAVTRFLARRVLWLVRTALSGMTVAMAVVAALVVLAPPTANQPASASTADESAGDFPAASESSPTTTTIFAPLGAVLPVTSRPDLALTEPDGPCVAEITTWGPGVIADDHVSGEGGDIVDPIASWDFVPTADGVVENRSGNSSLDLMVVPTSDLEWLDGGGVRFGQGGGALRTVRSAARMAEAIAASNAFTVSLTVRPAATELGGPARIVTLSNGASMADADFHVGQDGSRISNRIRYSCSPLLIWTAVDDVFAEAGAVRRVVVSFDGQFLRSYLDGELRSKIRFHTGSVLDWRQDLSLFVGNEASLDRPFLGDLLELSIHDAALNGNGVALIDHAESASPAD